MSRPRWSGFQNVRSDGFYPANDLAGDLALLRARHRRDRKQNSRGSTRMPPGLPAGPKADDKPRRPTEQPVPQLVDHERRNPRRTGGTSEGSSIHGGAEKVGENRTRRGGVTTPKHGRGNAFLRRIPKHWRQCGPPPSAGFRGIAAADAEASCGRSRSAFLAAAAVCP